MLATNPECLTYPTGSRSTFKSCINASGYHLGINGNERKAGQRGVTPENTLTEYLNTECKDAVAFMNFRKYKDFYTSSLIGENNLFEFDSEDVIKIYNDELRKYPYSQSSNSLL